jgi:hypothetical protein
LLAGAEPTKFNLQSDNSIDPYHFWHQLWCVWVTSLINNGFWVRWIDLLDP